MSIPYSYTLQEKEGNRTHIKEVKGVVSFNDHELLFEYKLYDLAGNSISTLNKFGLELDLLKRVEYKGGWFTGGKLVFQARQLVFFEPLPGSEQGKISLNIDRSHRNDAIEFSSRLNLDMSEKRLRDLEGD
ncbi:hypothetical protein AB2B38_013125 [Balneola sp. MJW-20]|uniref:hypothetical protein n=1 Tax=Gracilimonas aurantiaca TaxID=3234185 RepID=UPI003467ED1A